MRSSGQQDINEIKGRSSWTPAPGWAGSGDLKAERMTKGVPRLTGVTGRHPKRGHPCRKYVGTVWAKITGE